MTINTRNYTISLLLVALLIGGIYISKNQNDPAVTPPPNTSNQSNPTPITTLSHGHGLAVDRDDPTKLYIATHHGLFVLINDQELRQVGANQDDFMGFSTHPSQSNIMFRSGHPATGRGNLGFQRSDDGGVTWQQVSPGINGPVDFHSMAVSPVNPNLIYGWYHNALQRSHDQGETWELIPTSLSQVISLVASPDNEQAVYAATTQGILISSDKGATWNPLTAEAMGTATTLAIHPEQPATMLSFSERLGLARSVDGGKTWQPVNTAMAGQTVTFLAFSKTEPTTVYAYTHANEIHVSKDGGETWTKIH